MTRYDLSEAEWRIVEPLLPPFDRGKAPVDDRRVELSTKLHAVVDRDGLPVRLLVTAGQSSDETAVPELLAACRPPRRYSPTAATTAAPSLISSPLPADRRTSPPSAASSSSAQSSPPSTAAATSSGASSATPSSSDA